MENTKSIITVETTIAAPLAKVWFYWTTPEHIIQWNNASADWCTPHASNDLQGGGRFLYRMESTDGSMGFDFEGTYDEVLFEKSIVYTMDDSRKVTILFSADGHDTKITESFEAEQTNAEELQRAGWQAILDNFKRQVESN